MLDNLTIQIKRHEWKTRPDHHVVAVNAGSGWLSYLPSWNPKQDTFRSKRTVKASISRSSSGSGLSSNENPDRNRSWKQNNGLEEITGFRNPWPSWRKPSQAEVFRALEWGVDTDQCIELAASHITESCEPKSPSGSSLKQTDSLSKLRNAQADKLLRIMKPDFSFGSDISRAKATWLGHAGILVQLPPLKQGSRPLRCLFDPMFSQRASPTQTAGPIRSYAPPCAIEELPEIDILMISHNHYDHLDYDTVMAVWERNRNHMHFLVPLGNRQWFIECGINGDRLIELDWWDVACASVALTDSASQSQPTLKITCTPAQHNSGRSGIDANSSLWSSWYLEYSRIGLFQPDSTQTTRIFFAGDTGYQFHDSPGWPPPPTTEFTGAETEAGRIHDSGKYPACPAFREIAERIGPPHLLLLPVSVGATYDYIRSFSPLPYSISPIPRHSMGLTAHNHMPPWDAVRVLKLMTANASRDEEPSVAMAMHWGTFVTEAVEILKTLGQLEWACAAHDVEFARSIGDKTSPNRKEFFVAVHHGQSVTI